MINNAFYRACDEVLSLEKFGEFKDFMEHMKELPDYIPQFAVTEMTQDQADKEFFLPSTESYVLFRIDDAINQNPMIREILMSFDSQGQLVDLCKKQTIDLSSDATLDQFAAALEFFTMSEIGLANRSVVYIDATKSEDAVVYSRQKASQTASMTQHGRENPQAYLNDLFVITTAKLTKVKDVR